jgi:hypothetical protein
MDLVACSAPTITATATPMMSVVINKRFILARRRFVLTPLSPSVRGED